VPALLTPGEFVIRKQAVQNFGINKLHKINKMAIGGLVDKSGTTGKTNTAISMDTSWIGKLTDFATKMLDVADKFAGLTLSHTFNGSLEVRILGSEAMAAITPKLQEYVSAELVKTLDAYISKNGFPLREA
jgi:hypothetical protein